MSDAVIISIVSMVGGVLVAYIANVAAKKVQVKRASKQPKDRMEQMFDGYDRLIKQMSAEDERKAAIIHSQQKEINFMKDRLVQMETSLVTAQDELIDSNRAKKQLIHELDKIRKQYQIQKSDAS
jgi:hypothetical protein